jgi:hypothetical protein
MFDGRHEELVALREFAAQSQVDLETMRGFLALIVKSAGGTLKIERANSEVITPFHIVMRTVQEDDGELALEFKLLEGKEQIEEVMGKPSPIIVPK